MRIVGNHWYHLSDDGKQTLCGRVTVSGWGTNLALTENDIESILIDGADVDCNRCLQSLKLKRVQ